MKWLKWEQTYDGCPEWSRWDVHDEWFMTVVRDDGLVWEWYVAFCPATSSRGEGVARVECKSWALTRDRAMAQAEAWAEKHAVNIVRAR